MYKGLLYYIESKEIRVCECMNDSVIKNIKGLCTNDYLYIYIYIYNYIYICIHNSVYIQYSMQT